MAHGQGNPSASGREFYRVGQEVHDHLHDQASVGVKHRHIVGNIDFDRHAASLRLFSDQWQAASDLLRQVEGFRLDLEFPGLDFGQIQQIVDQGKQMLARVQNIHDIFRLFVVQRPRNTRFQRPGKPYHGVHRSAQLVAHIGEEIRFRRTGFQRDIARDAGLALGFMASVDLCLKLFVDDLQLLVDADRLGRCSGCLEGFFGQEDQRDHHHHGKCVVEPVLCTQETERQQPHAGGRHANGIGGHRRIADERNAHAGNQHNVDHEFGGYIPLCGEQKRAHTHHDPRGHAQRDPHRDPCFRIFRGQRGMAVSQLHDGHASRDHGEYARPHANAPRRNLRVIQAQPHEKDGDGGSELGADGVPEKNPDPLQIDTLFDIRTFVVYHHGPSYRKPCLKTDVRSVVPGGRVSPRSCSRGPQ